MTSAPQTSQLSAATLNALFDQGAATLQTVSADPECLLRVDPSALELSLLVRDDGTTPDLERYARVTVDRQDRDGEVWSVFTVPASEERYEAYGLLNSVVEAMRGGAAFAAAVNTALAHTRALLAARTLLTQEQQVGLVGELLAVRAMLGTAPAAEVLRWWIGPDGEQHDLALPGLDAEIKTTLADRRRHVISGAGQLTPNPGRPLWLVSIQITRADGGFSLPGLVHEVRELTHRDHRLDAHLEGLGWQDDDAELYDAGYALRTVPAAYLVDERFPAVTADRLRRVVPRDDLVDLVTYRVDVTDLDTGRPGGPLAEFCTGERA